MLSLFALVLDPSIADREARLERRVVSPTRRGALGKLLAMVFTLGAGIINLGLRLLMVGVTVWAGLLILRGTLSVIGIDRRLPVPSTDSQA